MHRQLEMLQKTSPVGPPQTKTLQLKSRPASCLLRDVLFVRSQKRAKQVLKKDCSPVQHLAAVTFLCMSMFVNANLCKLFANLVCWELMGWFEVDKLFEVALLTFITGEKLFQFVLYYPGTMDSGRVKFWQSILGGCCREGRIDGCMRLDRTFCSLRFHQYLLLTKPPLSPVLVPSWVQQQFFRGKSLHKFFCARAKTFWTVTPRSFPTAPPLTLL